jgi:hypothetical protein
VAKVGTSKAGGTISQQAVVHPWLAADAQGNKQITILKIPTSFFIENPEKLSKMYFYVLLSTLKNLKNE